MRSQQGFSLIELTVAVGLITLLAILTIASFATFQAQSDLDGSAEQMLNALRIAQSRTLASENGSSYGVHFEPSAYTLFAGRTYAAGMPTNEVKTLPSNVEIFTILLATSVPNVVFERLTGQTSATGTVGIRLVTDPTKNRTIRIAASGNVYLSASSVSELGTRLADTRHLHFNLGWSIQNAATLRLVFSDPPNPDVSNDVAMAPYFNAPRTSFSRENDTAVYGANQRLKVHTHLLDSANTLLSIHRDRRYNSKAATVSVIDGGVVKQIVSYDAGGSATPGTYGGAMIQQ